MSQNTALVVIDPQVGFTARTGAYARARGPEQWDPIRRAVAAIRTFDQGLSATAPRLWVRSSYEPGQFAPSGPLAELCLEGSPESAFDPALLPRPDVAVVTKHQTSATTAAEYRRWLDELVERLEIDRLTISGFLLTTCVLETAIGTAELLRGTGIAVAVPRDLAGARLGLHVSQDGARSRVEEAIATLTGAGIDTSSSVAT